MRQTFLLVLLLLAPRPVMAALTNLTPEQVAEASAHGNATYEERKGEAPLDDLDPGYASDLGADVGRAFLYTEFGAVSLETRRWKAIGRRLEGEDLQQILTPLRGRLRFSVTIVSDQRDVLRRATVRLHQGAVTHAPVSWNVFRATPIPDRRRFTAPGDYYFSTADLDLEAPVTLVIGDSSGPVIRFEFDLGRLR